MLPKNRKVINCLNQIDGFTKDALKSLNIYENRDLIDITLINGSVLYYKSASLRIIHPYVCAFDMDWTLSYNEKHLFPQLPDDIQIKDVVRNKLISIIKNGCTVVVFTNQLSKSRSHTDTIRQRLINFIKRLNLPIILYASLNNDKYRKPNSWMWNLFKYENRVEDAIFCGDAFTESFRTDLEFAENCGIRFIKPDDVFVKLDEKVANFILSSPQKKAVIFVGMPGCGKTTFYDKYLTSFVHINQDTLKTKAKVQSLFTSCIRSGKDLCVDKLNNILEERNAFVDTCINNQYRVFIIYFARDGREQNKQRDKPVSSIVYHLYFSKLTPPTTDNSHGATVFIL
jgi:DNA 3'-phosphatase